MKTDRQIVFKQNSMHLLYFRIYLSCNIGHCQHPKFDELIKFITLFIGIEAQNVILKHVVLINPWRRHIGDVFLYIWNVDAQSFNEVPRAKPRLIQTLPTVIDCSLYHNSLVLQRPIIRNH